MLSSKLSPLPTRVTALRVGGQGCQGCTIPTHESSVAPYLLSPVRPPRLECVTSAAWPLLTLQGHGVTLLSGSQTPDTPGTDSMPSARAALLARAKCRVPFPARYSPLTAQHAASWENHAAVSPVPLDFFPLFVSSLSGLSNCVVLGFRTVRPQLHCLRAV